ncbi:MAG: substrate-binding domain-containing protein [Spirochaetia bacterium]|nr:substrate-binding domain-containing protein [Spirochaetia bacterium]
MTAPKNTKSKPSKVKHLWLENELTTALASKEYRPHGLFFSEKAIERKYGVSFLTARKSLANMEKKGLVYRVPRKGTFVAPRRHKGTILVAFSSTFDWSEPRNTWSQLAELTFMAKLLELRDKDTDYEPHFVSGGPHVEERLREVRHHYPDVSGVLFFRDPRLFESCRGFLEKEKIPFLFYGSTTHLERLAGVPRLLYDEKEIVRLAMEHLAAFSQNPVGIIYQEHSSVHRARFDEAMNWLRMNGRSPAETLLISADVNTAPDVVLHRLEEMGRPPVSLWATDDAYLPGLVQALTAEGYRVPEDVALLGVNNMAYCEVFRPGLSSVEIPLSPDAERAFAALSDLASGKRKTFDERSRVALVARGSTSKIKKFVPVNAIE